jgi:hypothetical protein
VWAAVSVDTARAESAAVGLWRARLAMTRNRCMHQAERSLAAVEMHGGYPAARFQKDARIFAARCQENVRALESLDALLGPTPRRAVPEAAPRRALPEAAPRREAVLV